MVQFISALNAPIFLPVGDFLGKKEQEHVQGKELNVVRRLKKILSK